ncbi:MAG: putative Sensory transduction protein RegX3 [Nitrospira sp.]|nr:MAG: putative Sensory transduction protein RegX3 [Nitrospira sp.]
MSLEVIQIIEADQDHAREVDQILRKASFRTNIAFDGPTGIQDIWKNRPALVVLDLMVPGIGGKDVCRRLREDPQTKSMGIILVTALSSEDSRVAGLESGADDILTKPYSPRELVARIHAVLRRLATSMPENLDDLDDDLALDATQYVATFRGRQLVLTKPEWHTLLRLAKTTGKVVPREELRSLLWGNDALTHDRELDQLVALLNQKLTGQNSATPLIVKIAETGYRLLRKEPTLPLNA